MYFVAHNFQNITHTVYMKNKELIDELYEHSASAEECTGLLQKIEIDKDELRHFHKKFNENKP